MDSKQQRLFAEPETPWDADDAAEQTVATVVFPDLPTHTYDYLVPEALSGMVAAGQQVRAPLGRGNRPRQGFCVRVEMRPVGQRQLKALAEIVDARALISPAMLRLCEWLAENYLCGLGHALEAVLPAGVRDQAGTRLETYVSLDRRAWKRLGDVRLPPKQAAIVERLAASEAPWPKSELAAAVGCGMAPITALRRRGLLIEARERVFSVTEPEQPAMRQPDLELNADQSRALAAIGAALDSGRHETLLLLGVTGSGKTEVYIQAIQQVVGFGRQAIVLVPEISLTPQTRQRFRERFARVVVLHSHLTDAERHRHWQQIAAGEVQVVVGARSAVFAPAPHLGLIVIDEEHESSFKQETAPRYHARTVAIQRAREANIPLVLGSATPSLESWQRAVEGSYRLLELPRRVFNRPLPQVRTVDLRTEGQDKRFRGAISRPLKLAMDEALEDGGQVILLLNRRGFSTHIQCPQCGEAVRCRQCDIALTHHREREIALCHYCDFRMPTPQRCPSCGFAGIRYGGLGTQRLEAEVRARFPERHCLRMDTDTMRRPGSHERALAAFHAGEVQILLGTQMIAKGLDFPNVTLVGVINADTALHLPDFRAGERTFQLLAQVAGRTGRGSRGGRVLVQTFEPGHQAVQAAVEHDYRRFADAELPSRQRHGYPPYGELLRIVIRGDDERATGDAAGGLGERLKAARGDGVRMLGPAPAPIARLRGKYRFQLQLHGPDAAELRSTVRQVMPDFKPPEGVEWIVDVDPFSML